MNKCGVLRGGAVAVVLGVMPKLPTALLLLVVACSNKTVTHLIEDEDAVAVDGGLGSGGDSGRIDVEVRSDAVDSPTGDSVVPEVEADAAVDTHTDSQAEPDAEAGLACATGQKLCQGGCVAVDIQNPAWGCGRDETCASCPESPADGKMVCRNVGACDYACNQGWYRKDGKCLPLIYNTAGAHADCKGDGSYPAQCNRVAGQPFEPCCVTHGVGVACGNWDGVECRYP